MNTRSILLGTNNDNSFYPMSIPYSCRFDSARNCYLSRTPGVAGSQQKASFHGWVKRNALGTAQFIFNAYDGNFTDAGYFTIHFRSDDCLEVGGAATDYAITSAVFRDCSASFHLSVLIDTTLATANDRIQIWVNGVRQSLSTNSPPAQNANLPINKTTSTHYIGKRYSGSPCDIYLSDVYYIDGQALTPSSFGQFSAQNPNVWVPKTPSGLAYGTNGFHLAFGNAAALGTDTSGHGNTWTSSGLASTDQMADTPTNNYCTMNPLALGPSSSHALSNGNLVDAYSGSGTVGSVAGFAMPITGKWYWELKVTATSDNRLLLGMTSASMGSDMGQYPGQNANGYGYYGLTGNKFPGNTAYGATYAVNDIIGFAYDADAGTLVAYKNNVSQGTLAYGIAAVPWFPAIGNGTSGNTFTVTANFGANAFTYTPPTGFKALCSANLTDPAIIDSTKYFDAKLYTGTGAAQNITSFNFQPDLVWLKSRSNTWWHCLVDSVRGASKNLWSNSTNAEGSAGGCTAFLSNGYTLDGYNNANNNSDTFVSWCWKKGAVPGFDIVGYTGTGANRTVAHSLGAIPEMMIVKAKDQTLDWNIYHASLATDYFGLFTMAAFSNSQGSRWWQSTRPTSAVFYLGDHSNINGNTYNYIAYLFRSVPGFSLIGSYTGNGNADGPFVYCGFRPRWLLVKNATTAGYEWQILDCSRNTYNSAYKRLYANTSDLEVTGTNPFIDILSNGFKIRLTSPTVNGSGATYIFAAFAEQPFKYSNAR